MKRLLFDTESDGLLDTATKIHCAAWVDVDTTETGDTKDPAVLIAALDKEDVLIGHNIVRHDLPLLKKLYGWSPRPEVIIRDTMVCAKVIYPNVKETDGHLVRSGKMPAGRQYQGRHTLGAWGYRLGRHKGDYAQVKEAEAISKGITDPEAIIRYVWGQWNQEMHDYMLQDVDTNYALWKYLDVDNYSQDAIDLEHRIAFVCDQMNRAGVPFDVKAAQALHVQFLQRSQELEADLIKSFGSWYAPISPDPSRSQFTPKRDDKKKGYVAGQTMTKMKLVTFNPGSRDHIARVLKLKGWKPEKMTEGGKPQIDEEAVAGICAQYSELAGLKDYLVVEKRLSQLADGKQAWLQVVKDDGNIHGVIDPMGTTTSRASHFAPNLGQVVAVKSPYGKECRSLFYARPGWKIIGADMQGLELRALAHYLHPLDGGLYAKTVLEGDPHWVHAVAMSLVDGERDKHNALHNIIREDGSKRFIYAYIYGCGNLKAGEIIFACLDAVRRLGTPEGQALFDKFFPNGGGEAAMARVGAKVRNSFANRIDGFTKLKEKLERCVDNNNWIPGLDGRRIPTRSSHSALNFMLQSAGAILCKRWVCDAFDAMCARFKYDFDNPWNGDFVFGLWVHDEIQVWVREGLEEEASAILVKAAQEAGAPYNFRLRLDSEAKVGTNWAQTH